MGCLSTLLIRHMFFGCIVNLHSQKIVLLHLIAIDGAVNTTQKHRYLACLGAVLWAWVLVTITQYNHGKCSNGVGTVEGSHLPHVPHGGTASPISLQVLDATSAIFICRPLWPQLPDWPISNIKLTKCPSDRELPIYVIISPCECTDTHEHIHKNA